MPDVTMSINLTVHSCYRCGVPFGMPAEMDEQRVRDHRTFYCPNGHAQSYLKVKSLAGRQAEILKLHLEEQAEARAAEGKPPVPEPEPVSDTPETLIDKACPKCGKHYRSLACYRKHLRLVCKVEA